MYNIVIIRIDALTSSFKEVILNGIMSEDDVIEEFIIAEVSGDDIKRFYSLQTGTSITIESSIVSNTGKGVKYVICLTKLS